MNLLVVEHYAPLGKALSQGLREAGFTVDLASDGDRGLWLATTGDYDVIILDLMLPGMAGMEVLKAFRRKKGKAAVLILTARNGVDDRVRGLDAGADDYLVKPFAFEELLARVRAMVRRRYDVQNPVLDLGGLALDTVKRLVSWREQPISLTAREYAILHYLALRRGQVVSRTDLWEHVYDLESDTTSNVVDVYVSRLRKKLESVGAPPGLIRTRRGMGYVLETE